MNEKSSDVLGTCDGTRRNDGDIAIISLLIENSAMTTVCALCAASGSGNLALEIRPTHIYLFRRITERAIVVFHSNL